MTTSTEESDTTAGEANHDPTRSRRRRILRRILIPFLSVLVLFYGGLGWVFSSKIQNDAFALDTPGVPDYEVEVLAVDDDSIRLSLASDNHHLTELGVRGVSWPGGYGQIGPITSQSDDEVTRTYTAVTGTPDPGTLLDIDGYAYPVDPRTVHGLEFETLTFASDIGDMSAWHVPGASDRWVILVHGHTAPQREALRVLPTLAAAGYNAFVINYRNDVGVPQDPSGEYAYGLTEWKDVEAAVAYANQNGAEGIALVGYSMGGGIVTSFMLNSRLAGDVDAVVLDAPMLDFGATVDLGAENTSLPLIGLPLPQSLTNVAKLLAHWRFDIDWGALNYLDQADELATPILIFHGTEDETVPLGTSEKLAEKRADLMQLEIFQGAGHVQSWNVDPARYEQSVSDFLNRHLV